MVKRSNTAHAPPSVLRSFKKRARLLMLWMCSQLCKCFWKRYYRCLVVQWWA